MNNIYIYKIPYILRGPYVPTHLENRMSNEGDLSTTRTNFIKNRFINLDHLLFERYSWMNTYINKSDSQNIVEIGSGPGFSELYLIKKPILTDIVKNDWIDCMLDATKMPFDADSIDSIITSHTIHHFAKPYTFFMEVLRVLKENGVLLIQELHTSLLMRVLLRIMKHEGWSYDIDVFDPNSIVNNPQDPWSANCAVPTLYFENVKIFESIFRNDSFRLKVIRNELCESTIFPLSGGVIAKTSVPPLPKIFLEFFSFIDKALVKIAPNIFALGRRVVIKKVCT